MVVKIERGIPLPPKRNGSRGLTAALRQMRVGESFVWDEAKRGSVATMANGVGVKVTIRKIEEGRVRVWRIA